MSDSSRNKSLLNDPVPNTSTSTSMPVSSANNMFYALHTMELDKDTTPYDSISGSDEAEEPVSSSHMCHCCGGYNEAEEDEFESRIKDYVIEKVWPNADHDSITLERLPNTTMWNLFSLSWGTEGLVFRTPAPMMCFLDPNKIVHSQMFVEEQIGLPVPKVISQASKKDETTLDRPFILQRKVKGKMLSEVYAGLSHTDKCQLATELGTYARKMLDVSCGMQGDVSLHQCDDIPGEVHLVIEPWIGYEERRELQTSPALLTESYQNIKNASPKESVFETMERMALKELNYIRAHLAETHSCPCCGHHCGDEETKESVLAGNNIEEEEDREPEEVLKAWKDGLRVQERILIESLKVVKTFNERGYLESDRFSLDATTFDPEKIMVDNQRSPGDPMVKAFFDVNAVLFGAKFMSCDPPMFLWTPDEPQYWNQSETWERLDKRQANRDLDNAELQEIKELFDEAAGPEYVKYAYPPQYRMARDLTHILLHSEELTGEGVVMAEALLKEAQEFLEAEGGSV